MGVQNQNTQNIRHRLVLVYYWNGTPLHDLNSRLVVSYSPHHSNNGQDLVHYSHANGIMDDLATRHILTIQIPGVSVIQIVTV